MSIRKIQAVVDWVTSAKLVFLCKPSTFAVIEPIISVTRIPTFAMSI